MAKYRVIPAWTHWHRAFVWWGWGPEPVIYVPAKRLPYPDWIRLTLAHERVHVAQWKKHGRIGFLRRYLCRDQRLELEAEAFAASVKAGGGTAEHYATVLAKSYGLHAPVDVCFVAINSYLEDT